MLPQHGKSHMMPVQYQHMISQMPAHGESYAILAHGKSQAITT